MALILLLATASAAAQSDPSSTDRDASRVKSTSVPVDVTVVDASGNPRLDLTAADFEIFEDGEPRNLRSFTPPHAAENEPAPGEEPGSAARPRHFLLLVGDLGADPFDSIGDLADFVEGLGPRDHVALMAYRRVGDFTNRHKETAAALRDYRRVYSKTHAVMQRHVQARLLLDSRTPPRLPDSVRTGVREFFAKHGWASRELLRPPIKRSS